jgi:glutathione S-transferase
MEVETQTLPYSSYCANIQIPSLLFREKKLLVGPEEGNLFMSLEGKYGSLGCSYTSPHAQLHLQLFTALNTAWITCLKYITNNDMRAHFLKSTTQLLDVVNMMLIIHPGPWFLPTFSVVDVVFILDLEKMNACLLYYIGFDVRGSYPNIHTFMSNFEKRPTWREMMSSFVTLADVSPMQELIVCSPIPEAFEIAKQIRCQRYTHFANELNELCYPEPSFSKTLAVDRVLRHIRGKALKM